jgi:predicted MFS family arabinose efflux permease
MKRSLSFEVDVRQPALVGSGLLLIAGSYGLVRLAYGLYLPDIQGAINLSSSLAGVISSGASVAYCIGALAGVVFPDRPRALIVAAIGSAAAGSLGMAFAGSVFTFAPAAIVASASAGLASPAMVSIVARSVCRSSAGRAQSVVNSGTGPGLVAAGVLALTLPTWRWGFALSALVTAAAGLAVLALDQRDRLEARDVGSRMAPGLLRGLQASWAALRLPAGLALLLGVASASVWTFGRAHIVAGGASSTLSIVAWIAIGIGGAATVLTARGLARLRAHLAWMVSVSVLAGSVLALGHGEMVLALMGCVLFGWSFVAATSALISWSEEAIPSRSSQGTALAFVLLVLGQAIGSTLTASIANHWSMEAGLTVSATVAAGAAAAALARGRGTSA